MRGMCLDLQVNHKAFYSYFTGCADDGMLFDVHYYRIFFNTDTPTAYCLWHVLPMLQISKRYAGYFKPTVLYYVNTT